MYKVVLHSQVTKTLAKFPKKDQARLAAAIRELGVDPRPAGCVHLRETLYRIRVGEYRVLYAVADQQLIVVVVKATRRSERTYAEIESLIARARKLLG
ncbi:MAG: type II toxin-antitoxin system RelE/ParE family toxin [Anaerolineales bacterium]|nr:type II toxin-antitoxin system RelE/ParE family toxin [Anaerolineales bacterium]